MMTPRLSLSPRPVASGLALLIALAHGTIASAQGHTPDPYRPYNSVYDPYVYPIYPSGDGYFPNQNRLTGRSGPARANQFQEFLDENRLGTDPSGLIEVGRRRRPLITGAPPLRPREPPKQLRSRSPLPREAGRAGHQVFRGQEEVSGGRERAESAEAGPPHQGVRRRETARRAGLPEGPEPSAPGQRSAIGPQEPANPPAPRRPRGAGPRPSSSPALRLPRVRPPCRVRLGLVRPLRPPARPRRIPPTARTPSQILQESESLDRSDRPPTPPQACASSRRPTPR